MTTILEMEQVSKRVSTQGETERVLLNAIHLSVKKGDFVTVLGGNGAGKSTLFNSIAGSTSLSQGRVSINGQNITKWEEEKRAKYVSRVFQDPKMGTAPRMTVGENLLLALKRGEKRTLLPRSMKTHKPSFAELCKQAGNGLENHLDTPTEFLSGGQRQSLSLLMATLKDPSLLLLDEHTAALDPQTSKRLMQLTDEVIRERELTCLMITHRMEDALDYGNRLIVLEEGSIKYDLNESDKSKLSVEDLLHLFEREETVYA
ncbi:ATP-binding cassette domain-containing protein [Alkalibacterium iburiense]|uniref:ATP-binding cassette domain-containing protein n=1 Tax=Alkalibacterium iburiense TaxID=290589 RepID=A0ABN0XGL7_9LACT